MKELNLTLKSLLIGDGGVGKTSLVSRYVDNTFGVDYKITVGIAISSKAVTMDNGITCNLAINDIAGQERFNHVRKAFYSGTNIVVAVFDLTRRLSLRNLEKNWIPELLEANPSSVTNLPIKIILVGNKSDLEDLRMVTEEEARAIAKKIDAIDYIETSAKDNKCVEEAFKTLIQAFVDSASLSK